MNKRMVLAMVAMLVVTASLGGLFAQTGTTGISVSASGTAASGATVTTWSVGAPSWTPVEGAVGVVSGGGIARIKLPNSPAGEWAISLYLDDPNELVQAYSFWNPKIQVRTVSTSGLTSGSSAIPTVGSGGNAAASTFTGGSVVTDSLNGDTYHTLTLEKGFVTFNVSSADGVPVDASDEVTSIGV